LGWEGGITHPVALRHPSQEGIGGKVGYTPRPSAPPRQGGELEGGNFPFEGGWMFLNIEYRTPINRNEFSAFFLKAFLV